MQLTLTKAYHRAVTVLGILLFTAVLGACASATGPTQYEPPTVDHPPLEEVDDPSPSPSHFRDLSPIAPDSELSLAAADADWYKDAVFYHIWINAFNDSTGDGVGDIPGITEKLDYLVNLGVTGIWLSPFFESASQEINLHMYDTTDHYRVDPRFGTNEDLDELLAEAHARDIRVIFDWVPNHISNEHPWFIESAAGENDREDWFVWRDEPGSQEGPWGQSVWHRHSNDSYYYGVFWSGMPDINFRHQAAKDAITDVAVYWLNRGFDGMRIDAIKYLYEDKRSLRGGYEDQDGNFEYFQAVRSQILDEFGTRTNEAGDGYHKFMVAENWTSSHSSLESYMVDQDGNLGFQMTLDFPFAYAAANRIPFQMHNHWRWVTDELDEDAWMGTFLSNHDNVVNRPYSVHGEPAVRAVVATQLLAPGTPFLYYGNEIGMVDASEFGGASHADRRHRQPFEWELMEQQDDDPDSLLNIHRRLTELRHERGSLRRGDYTMLSTSDQTLVYLRSWEGETTLSAINLGEETPSAAIELPEGYSPAELLLNIGDGSLEVADGQITGTFAPAGITVWDLTAE